MDKNLNGANFYFMIAVIMTTVKEKVLEASLEGNLHTSIKKEEIEVKGGNILPLDYPQLKKEVERYLRVKGFTVEFDSSQIKISW